MPELTITDGPGSGARISLSPDQAYTVGADPQDSIHVDGEGIAARHLIVKALKSGGFGIKGLAGPFRHNDAEVQVARLKDGDRIELGPCVLAYSENSVATPAPAAEPKQVGRELGGFRLFEVLGKGGMGTVYRAEQVSLGREVALKVLSKDLTKDPVFVARFVAEARAAARLHHPNVVQVFDVDNVDETYFYSMELMSRGSLEDRLRAEGKVPADIAVTMIRDAARGLGFAESLRMVHRDIKPDNLMVDQHGHIKIADLGLAHSEEDSSAKLLGTPHFMSPEQIQRQPLDHRSDLYSLGCTFYRLVTGRTPFRASTVKQILRAQVKEAHEAANRVEPGVPAEVSAVIDTLLQKDPDARFQSADDLIEALDTVAAPPSRKGLLIGGIAVAVAVTAGAIIWAVTREDRVVVQRDPVVISDPNAEANRIAKRESDAKAEYYELQARGLDGLPKAAALEAMAAEFDGTEFATTATTDASQIRADVERQRIASQRRAQAIETAVATLRGSFDAALRDQDYRAADALLSLDTVPAELRTDPTFAPLVDELRPQITTTAQAHLATLKATADSAQQQRDPVAIENSMRQLTQLVSGPEAWPDSALPDRAGLERYISDTRLLARSIADEARTAAAAASWRTATTSVLSPDGVLAAVRDFRFEDAAKVAERAASQIADSAPGTRLTELAAAARAAARFVNDFTAAAATGNISIENGEPGVQLPTVKFVAHGSDAGLTVKDGRKDRLIPIADLQPQLCTVFAPLNGATDDANRAAFLALTAIALHVDEVQRFLAAIDAGDDASGTGNDAAFRGNTALFAPEIRTALLTSASDWARSLLQELSASTDIARALRAFSVRRNTTSANLLDRTLTTHADTFVVRCLK